MATIYTLAGVALVICVVTIASVMQKRRREKANRPPPPLPPRVNVGISSPAVSWPQDGINSFSAARVPPSRQSHVSTGSNAARGALNNRGPRGIKPDQFPCCPYDKLRNVPGETQVIFWDSEENCYRCSRGHRFKRNGKLL